MKGPLNPLVLRHFPQSPGPCTPIVGPFIMTPQSYPFTFSSAAPLLPPWSPPRWRSARAQSTFEILVVLPWGEILCSVMEWVQCSAVYYVIVVMLCGVSWDGWHALQCQGRGEMLCSVSWDSCNALQCIMGWVECSAVYQDMGGMLCSVNGWVECSAVCNVIGRMLCSVSWDR